TLYFLPRCHIVPIVRETKKINVMPSRCFGPETSGEAPAKTSFNSRIALRQAQCDKHFLMSPEASAPKHRGRHQPKPLLPLPKPHYTITPLLHYSITPLSTIHSPKPPVVYCFSGELVYAFHFFFKKMVQ